MGIRQNCIFDMGQIFICQVKIKCAERLAQSFATPGADERHDVIAL